MSAPAIPFWSSVGLVADREIRSKLRSKAFVISGVILLLAVLASIIFGSVAAQNPEDIKVAAAPGATQVVSGLDGVDVTTTADVAEAEQLVRDETVAAAVVPDDGTLGYSLVALDSEPDDLVMLLSVSPEVQLLDPAPTHPILVYLVALGFGLIFFMAALTFGATIAQSVVEEKSTRVVELLLSAIPARALLAGKVIGNSVLALGQIVLIALAATAALALTGQQNLLTALGPSVIWFIAFFAVGFVLLAAIFAASAALVSRQEDVGAVTTPVTMLVMIPYFLIVFFNDNDLVLTIMSYVPFSAPVGMPMRIFLGTAEWWEPLLSLAIMLATTAAVVVLGARVYENSLLRMGGRVKLGEALRG
ncbi:ABC transporter permease [Naasia sp. SYSU D00057]|uniref:ABC transporter permease n=1 Tax=Naasia sp. SYSU D00057 TaxID=2817380 RepID=UPI001B312176|nr:ABC transporter permease [Naasia sp. SYSU D00057]